MWRDIVMMDARRSLGLTKVAATTAVKDETAKTVKAIAEARSLSVDAYKEKLDVRVAAALDD